MPIITLTTDLGDKDHYAGSLKGVILSQDQEARIIDITHHITAFNILEAAYVLKSSWKKYPEGTIHLLGVDPEGEDIRAALQCSWMGIFFWARIMVP